MKFIAARWRHRAAEVFGIDLRTLALFRAALGALLAFYVLNRLPDAMAFYTDWGVLPRYWLLQTEDAWSRLSLYHVNGDAWFVFLLLFATLASAIALLVGYRTRLAILAAFVLFASLINRNPIVLIGGDGLLVCLLFWAMFLPLGARWSVDAALSTVPPPAANAHASWASAGLVLQVLSVYFFSAILKSGADYWPDGTAVYYTMELERYASPLGRELAGFPRVMQGLSYYVYFLEMLGPLLALSPWAQRPLRFVVMACLMAMHIGFIGFMEIGHFPFVSLASLTTLLGGWFWDWRAKANETRHPLGPKIYYDRDCGFCLKSCLLLREFLVLPRAHIAPAQDSVRANALLEANYSWVVIDADDRAHIKWSALVALLKPSPVFGWLHPLLRWSAFERPGDWVYDWVGRHRGAFGRITATLLPQREIRFEVGRPAQRVAGVFVVLVLIWNLVSIHAFPRAALLVETPLFRIVRIDQLWNMFAPYPSRRDGWPVFPGKLEDGTEVDVLRPGERLTWDRPPSLSAIYENIAWHTYRWRILDKPYQGHLLYYGKYLCRDWNIRARPGKRLVSFQMAFLEELSVPPGATPGVERRVVWYHDCKPQDLELEKQRREERRDDPTREQRTRPV
jgi:predicted DCC family thiol-disulfide oxidoreductase YuxK